MTININSLSQAWNAAGTTFTGIKLNVTDTASAPASLLMDLQLGGASKFQVGRGTLASPSIIVGAASNPWGLWDDGSGGLHVSRGGTKKFYFFTTGPQWGMPSTGSINWSSNSAPDGAYDLGILRVGVSSAKVTDGSTGLGSLLFKLPNTDPHIVGALWNNTGTITISAG